MEHFEVTLERPDTRNKQNVWEIIELVFEWMPESFVDLALWCIYKAGFV